MIASSAKGEEKGLKEGGCRGKEDEFGSSKDY